MRTAQYLGKDLRRRRAGWAARVGRRIAARGRVSAFGAVALVIALTSTTLAAVPGDSLRLGVTNTINALTTVSGNVANRLLAVTNTNTGTGAVAISAETKSNTAPAIRAVNSGSTGGHALELWVRAGKAPLVVNSTAGKATNLNADKLDGLDHTQLQRRASGVCAPGSSIRAISATGAATCEPDDNSGGDITSVAVGPGLTGGGTAGATTLSADTSYLQRRITDGCAVGSIQSIAADGTVVCETKAGDADTLDGLDSTAFLPSAGKATDSDTLDGIDSDSFLRSDGKATNSDALDGLDSTSFLAKSGKAADAELLDGLDSSAFLRTGGKATDADTLDGIDSTGFLRSTGKAADSDRLDSLDSTAFLRSNGKALDAEKLDGRDSSEFMQGRGQALHGAQAIPQGNVGWRTVVTLNQPEIVIGYTCPADLATNGVLVIRNDSPQLVNVFSDNGSGNPEYRQLAASGGRWDQWAAATGERITVQVQGSQMATVDVFSVHRTTDCHVQAQAVITR